MAPRSLPLIDQALSSLSNVLAVVLVARSLSPEEFGRFSVSYGVAVFALGVSRNFFGTRISLSPDNDAARASSRAASGALTLLAPVLVVAVLGASAVLAAGAPASILVPVAVATPAMLVQDVLRFGSIAGGRPAVAVASDGVWAGILATPLLMGLVLDPVVAVWLWAAAAYAALTVALLGLRWWPQLRAGVLELRTRHAVGESVTVGAIAIMGAGLAVQTIALNVVGPAAAGFLRGASTLMGPVNVLFNFIPIAVTPVLVRDDRSRLLKACVKVSAALALVVLVWASILLLLPDTWGTALLGESWDGVRSILPFTSVEYLLIALGPGANLGLRVLGAARRILVQRLVSATGLVIFGAAGAFITNDVRGVAVGLIAGAALNAILVWINLVRHFIGAKRAGFPEPTGSGSQPSL